MPSRKRSLGQYARDFFTNWGQYDAPLSRKVALTARNRLIAAALLRGCCGHHGEPGC
jgi:hypothetical protein